MPAKKRKSSAPASYAKASGTSSWKVYFKYLLIMLAISATAYAMFINRVKINEQVKDKVAYVKDKVADIEKGEHSANTDKNADGYNRKDRDELKALISKETK